ncbi:MAG: C40 family peptidase [Sphingobacteriales bacterium]|nr:C40 family peptidase [Sphingobacteriales bacterium]
MQNFLGICQLSVIPIRANPEHRSEMVSQLIFGDTFEILAQENQWLKIKNRDDDYEGWVNESQVSEINEDFLNDLEKQATFLTREVNVMLLKGSLREPIYVPAGSLLPFYEASKCRINQDIYQVTSSNIFIPNQEEFASDITETAKMFLNVPYLWGGRTHAGIDCSGFAQIVFKMLGIQLKRDASQQAEQGKLVDFLTEAKAGDLAFFDNEEGRITHVGIMLNNSQIIHASGRVKIDRIDNQGIFAVEQNKYTHRLRIVKRFI